MTQRKHRPRIAADITETVGNTPLVRLTRMAADLPAQVIVKLESFNPMSSVKCRLGAAMIEAAEEDGLLGPGKEILEPTSGNTGIGLALVGNARGFRTLIMMPDTQTQEKKDALRLCGAKLQEVPAVPFKDPNNYVHVAERTATELAKTEPHGVFYANQWDNPANREGHIASTGPEIWEQTDGQVDAFICAVGTGGTLSGVSEYLKQQNPNIVTAAADPMGAAIFSWIKTGELKSEGSSISEGIGQGRITGNLIDAKIDDAFSISDHEMMLVCFDLLLDEGLLMGGSSGINVAGAIRLAKQLGPGKTIVTILCDSGSRYQSKLYNPEFLESKDLPLPPWLKT